MIRLKNLINSTSTKEINYKDIINCENYYININYMV